MSSDDEDGQLLEELQALKQAIEHKRNLSKTQSDASNVVSDENLSFKTETNFTKNQEQSNFDDIEHIPEKTDDNLSGKNYNDYSCENLQDLLELNKKLLDAVLNAREEMQAVLDECIRKKQALADEIAKLSSSKRTKIISFNAGMPYFKDKNHYTAKMNEDTATKIKNGELRLAQLQRIQRWNQDDKSSLLKAIRHEVLLTLSKKNDSDESYIDNAIKKSSQLPQDVKKAIGPLGAMKFDWLKIANSMPENKHSAEECEVMWNVFLHPDINKQKWTSQEDKKLNQIVAKFNFENWNAIAKSLKTKRSGYQCFIRFNTNNWKNLMKGQSWTPFDDRTLCHLVSKLRVGDYIPWGYIASCMNSWTKQQVYFRWTYSLAPHLKKGRFSPAEDEKLLEAVEKYGFNFSKISGLVLTNRTHVQLKEHYQTLCAKSKTDHVRKVWTYDDDTQLLDLYEKHGAKWAKIVEDIPGVSRVQARQRYNCLMRYIKKGITLNNIDRGAVATQPAHTTVTYTTNTPWSRENKEIHVNHLKNDDQLVRYFKREAANQEKKSKTYLPEKLAIDTHKLYRTLVKLNVDTNLPEYIEDSNELTEKYFELLTSLQDYTDSRQRNLGAEIERVRLRMFGPQKPLSENERFIPPLPFNFCLPRKFVWKKNAKDNDLTINNQTHQIEVTMELHPSKDVWDYLGEDLEMQFEKVKKMMVAPIKSSPKVYLLKCKPFASSHTFRDSFQMKYDWKQNKLVPTQWSDLMPDKIPEPEIVPEDCVPLAFLEPSRQTLETYQEVIFASSRFSAVSESTSDPRVSLSSRGQHALIVFKRRFQQLFRMPIGLSRIIPPDIVDESSFLPAIEKLKKKNFKKTRVSKKRLKGLVRQCPNDE
ncbi:snRNA-activating protein complex subunit 4 [Copidosoma floridanum]|uniref:snRNA-activating protein complex subunit 4 n=1 Tax=Copidosoma floridanum TaxID=29053 RepID=UPI0006C9DBA7|nr:snRNA-activating protein complex subunit 4 [Copidosoma floridanum]